jgi:mannan endo-1,4-beta-mannosidase
MKTLVILMIFILSEASFAGPKLVDSDATFETKRLFENLAKMSGDKMLFGHQAAVIEGVGWNKIGISDVAQISGQLPGVVGFDFVYMFEYPDWHKEDRFHLAKVKEVYDQHRIVTFSWHVFNPITNDGFDGDEAAFQSVLPGGSKHQDFLAQLDFIADFAHKAIGSDQKQIPIIIRLFHEQNGTWFWWSKSSDADFVRLWKFVVEYLRDTKKVRNFLYAYSPDKFQTAEEYLAKYPGDDWVDLMGLDCYAASVSDCVPMLGIVVDEATKRKKISALTETGVEGVPNPKYWTENFLDPIRLDAKAKQIAYAMVWRNENVTHHYAPFPGHSSVPDFLQMFGNPFIFKDFSTKSFYQQQQ